jgi:hypothetical protein
MRRIFDRYGIVYIPVCQGADQRVYLRALCQHGEFFVTSIVERKECSSTWDRIRSLVDPFFGEIAPSATQRLLEYDVDRRCGGRIDGHATDQAAQITLCERFNHSRRRHAGQYRIPRNRGKG